MYYFTDGEQPVSSKEAKKAPLEWFEYLLEAIRPWANGKTGSAIPIDLTKSEGTIKRILQILSENFLTVSGQMRIAQATNNRPSVEFFHPFYRLTKYEVNIRFRLNEEGRVIQEEEGQMKLAEERIAEEDLFQIEVQLKGHWVNGRPIVRFKILPPDFLSQGPLYLAFLEKLNEQTTGKNGSKTLRNLADKLRTQPRALATAINKRPSQAFIFRIERGRNWDKNVFVLPISDSDGERYLWFNAKFRVDAQNNTVTYKKNSLENLLTPEGQLRNEGVRYFLRLLFQINEWKNKVV